MIQIELHEIGGIRPAIAGMRFAKKSEERSTLENDLELIDTLERGGNPHNKFLRQMFAVASVTAPRSLWPQIDTYRMGVEKNSESIMHTITKKRFEYSDFQWTQNENYSAEREYHEYILGYLNDLRDLFLRYKEKKDKRASTVWRELVDKLPQSYLQKRMCKFSYAALQKIYFERKDHKMEEWHVFCRWIESLPLSWLITGKPHEEMSQEETTLLVHELVLAANDIQYPGIDRVYNGYGKQRWYQGLKRMLEVADCLLFEGIDLNFLNDEVEHLIDTFAQELSGI